MTKIKTFNEKVFLQGIGKPLIPFQIIPIKIKKIYSDVNGAIIAKNILPVALQKKTPVYLLGQFDRNGGYTIGNQILLPEVWQFLGVFTVGFGVPFLFATGLNTVKNQISIGDIVIVYCDNLDTPTYYQFVIISSDKNSLASITANSQTTQQDGRLFNLYVEEFNYEVDTNSQYNEVFHYVNIDNIGNFEDNQISPFAFRNPYTEQETVITVKTPFKVDQYLGIYFNMLFSCDNISMTFKAFRK